MCPNFAPSPPVETRIIAKPSRVARTERALPSFDHESPRPYVECLTKLNEHLEVKVRILFTGEG
jgi:hypothetical protein